MEEIKGFENYYIDVFGRIYNKKRMRMKTTVRKDGYETCTIRRAKKPYSVYIHRLVAAQFIPNVNNLPQVNHINGIKHDNTVDNLEWVTAKQNTVHAVETGLAVPKIDSYKKASIKNRKVSPEDELKIKELHNNGLSFRGIALAIGVHHKTVSGIVNQTGDFRARPDNRNKKW